MMKSSGRWKFLIIIALVVVCRGNAQVQAPQAIPTSKSLVGDIPGQPRELNSLPAVMAVSPDGRYVATVNAGYGTVESGYKQSIALLGTMTGRLRDFPDDRTLVDALQTFFDGLVFSSDGSHLYASIDSITDPEGKKAGSTGNAIVVYAVKDGAVTPERLIPIPLQTLAAGKTQSLYATDAHKAIPYPTGLALTQSAGGEALLIADNYSDDVLLVDTATGRILQRIDLSRGNVVPTEYPIAVAVTPDGGRAFVALWNTSEIAEVNLRAGKVSAWLPLLKPELATAPGSHPSALLLEPKSNTLYVVLSNRDRVAVVNVKSPGKPRVKAMLDTSLPGANYMGAQPVALALSNNKLYVADADANAVAIFSRANVAGNSAERHPDGFIPTEWYPMALAATGGKLYIATGKGLGTGPNNFAQKDVPDSLKKYRRSFTYVATLLHGSLATVSLGDIPGHLQHWTSEVIDANHVPDAEEEIAFAGKVNPIRHVIYIIKENRTYDQVYGDLNEDGHAVGNGDPSLTMYGAAITPNLHKLALQFGVLDNFYDSGEVSGVGHVWSTAAITSDYSEKIWQPEYRGDERSYDFEGVVAGQYPLLQGIPDVNEPGSGYLWGDLARHGKTYIHFAEFVSTQFCDGSGTAPKQQVKVNPQEGSPQVAPALCKHSAINAGEAVPEIYGGGVSKYPWAIPLIVRNVATKPELRGHFDPDYPDFNLNFPDQMRVAVFEHRLKAWVAEREAGKPGMPEFVMLRLPNDHTAGTTAGKPTPKASVADNDLAVGRAVDAISHSPYWDDTAFFIIEDDSQNGGDHVNAHRSTALIVSKYSPRLASGPYVDSHYYTTVSILRTMETLMGLPPMNFNDGYAPVMAGLFTGDGSQPTFDADYSNRDNGVIYTANTAKTPGAKESGKMDFTHPDQADAYKLNMILWRDAMGTQPLPSELKHKSKEAKDDDDD
jgi:DNA-binding beta-propeller fold protein YncE